MSLGCAVCSALSVWTLCGSRCTNNTHTLPLSHAAVACHGMILRGRPVRVEYSPYKKKAAAGGLTPGSYSAGIGGLGGRGACWATSHAGRLVSLSVCLSVCLSLCLSVCLPACLSVCLPISLHITPHHARHSPSFLITLAVAPPCAEVGEEASAVGVAAEGWAVPH